MSANQINQYADNDYKNKNLLKYSEKPSLNHLNVNTKAHNESSPILKEKFLTSNEIKISKSDLNLQAIDPVENDTEKTRQLNTQSSRRSKKSKGLICCTRIIKLMFSNVGLVLVVFLYSTVGALMFQLLEQHEELRLCEEGRGRFMKEVKYYREEIVRYVIFNVSSNEGAIIDENNDLYSNSYSYINYTNNDGSGSLFDNQTYESSNSLMYRKHNNLNNSTNETVDKYYRINILLEDFRRKIIEIENVNKYTGQDCVEDSKWNFFSALLFTITIVSTVGYGFIAPVTWEGRIVCICYASIGIPIFLLCLANLSSSLGHILTFIYAKIDSINPITKFLKKRKLQKKLKRRQKKRLAAIENKTNNLNDDSQFNIANLERASYADNRNLMLLTMDGQSSIAHGELSSNVFIRELDDLADGGYIIEESDDDDLSDSFDYDDDDYFGGNEVPVSVALLIIVLYILGGAFIFQEFEGWTLIQSSYFVYVTLSTMGFGDLVPGQAKDDRHANAKQLVVCFYSLFGMAIIGMCFNVMQGVARRKISWLLHKLKRFTLCPRGATNKKDNEKDKFEDRGEAEYTLEEREKERNEILNKLRMLKQYENILNSKRRKKHVLS